MLANQLYISGAIIDTRFKKLRFEKQEVAGAVPGSVDAEAVSYTHLTLPTNREV